LTIEFFSISQMLLENYTIPVTVDILLVELQIGQ